MTAIYTLIVRLCTTVNLLFVMKHPRQPVMGGFGQLQN